MVTVRLSNDDGIRAIITRPIDAGEPHALVVTSTSVHPLLGLSSLSHPNDIDAASRLRLGTNLKLRIRQPDGKLEPFFLPEDEEFWRGTCDAVTGRIYISTKSTVLQLEITGDDNILTLLAGETGEEDTVDGPGVLARVDRPFCMVADGHGSLLIKDCGSSRIRRMVLPPAGSPPGAPSPLVMTLPCEYAGNLWAVAMEYSDPQRLYVTTKTAIYRHDKMPYSFTHPSPSECADLAAALLATDSAEPPDDPTLAPTLIAGREGDTGRTDGLAIGVQPPTVDAAAATGGAAAAAGSFSVVVGSGSGAQAAGNTSAAAGSSGGAGRCGELVSTARFAHITYMAVDAVGRLIIVEREVHDVEPLLRIVWPSGLVTSFNTEFDVSGSEFVASILPGGWLALHAWDSTRVQLLRLEPGLRPSVPAPAAPAGAAAASAAAGLPGLPGLGGLAADLGALLDGGGGDGDGEGAGPAATGCADVTVEVGGKSFSCHRAILGARCQYFRRLFQGGFADSSRSKVSLPDADPEAFALLLRYMYCAAMDYPPRLLQPLAELADRLLLPAASRTAQLQLLAATGPSSVVEHLLWAEAQGFQELLAGLKDYYLSHAHAVLEEAPDSLETLMLRSPKLHLELYAAGIKRARRK